ncbi:unnamed protein product [Sphagnum jensenii]|uniref:Uncharacterized protein n=1 Tax=Sphagnum jensenii TaxID=128206 RepID=A0ABP1BYM0_9BRYO
MISARWNLAVGPVLMMGGAFLTVVASTLLWELLLIFMDLTDLQKSSSTKEVKELRVIVSRDGDRNHWSWWSVL